MAKNNFVIAKAKEIERLRKKINLDCAYIGAGLILALKENGFDDDQITQIMASTNEIWTRLAQEGINPLKYCEEQTGFVVATEKKQMKSIHILTRKGNNESKAVFETT